MEIFVDFGVIELLAALGIAALSRVIYAKKILGILFLIVSVLAPLVLVIEERTHGQRFLAAVCLVTALVNAAVVAAVMQNGAMPRLKLPPRGRKPPLNASDQAQGGVIQVGKPAISPK